MHELPPGFWDDEHPEEPAAGVSGSPGRPKPAERGRSRRRDDAGAASSATVQTETRGPDTPGAAMTEPILPRPAAAPVVADDLPGIALVQQLFPGRILSVQPNAAAAPTVSDTDESFETDPELDPSAEPDAAEEQELP